MVSGELLASRLWCLGISIKRVHTWVLLCEMWKAATPNDRRPIVSIAIFAVVP